MAPSLQIANTGAQVPVQTGDTVLTALQRAGMAPNAPCGGRGVCGKCTVLVDGQKSLACQIPADRDMTVELPEVTPTEVLTAGRNVSTTPDGVDDYVLGIDIGTTTVAVYLMDGKSGALLSQASCVNPQTQFGADVISRIQYVLHHGSEPLAKPIRAALAELTQSAAQKAGISSTRITKAAIVGNTAMHHLFLGINPKPLTVPPYMPKVSRALELPAREYLPIHPDAVLWMLPNIAGFVGADTVGCLVSTRFDRFQDLTLLIDIGTNGEMVLGRGKDMIACSTAAGPAFEGAKIRCGMRGATGAIDHVSLQSGELTWTVIGGSKPVGLCGSGLVDLVAALLNRGDIQPSGRMKGPFCLEGTEVFLTQKDIREVQLAKAAIRAGIELLCKAMGTVPEDIRRVLLAGAFGNYMNPASACAIGMFPACLLDKIESMGNAAGQGAKLCALSGKEFAYSKALAAGTRFLELASDPEFNNLFVNCLSFGENT